MTPERARRARRLPLHLRCPDRPSDALGRLDALAPTPRGPRGRAPARRLSGLHDVGRLAGLPGRQDPAPLPRGAGRGLDAVQDEGRGGRRRRPAPRRRIVREEIGPGPDAGGRRQPALGRRRGDRLDGRARPSSTRTGSRSRRAPTTSSATRRSPAAVAPIRVATGEHVHNRVMFKQLLQAERDRRLPDRRLPPRRGQRGPRRAADGRRVRACRSARTPAASGLCELVQHLSVIDYVCVSGSLEGRMIEYVDHLHEHFLDPVVIRDGALRRADAAGLQRRDAAGVARALSVPGRRGVARGRSAGDEAVRRSASDVRPERIDEYERLHAEPWPGVLDQIRPLEHPQLLDLPRRHRAVRLLRVRRRRLRGRHGGDGRRRRRPSAGGRSPTRCRSRSRTASPGAGG